MLEAIGIGLVIFAIGMIPVALILNDIEPSIEVVDKDRENKNDV